MITNIDDNMGKLLSFLEDENLKNNTILIYMTDNGTSAGIKWDNRKNKNIGYNFNMKGKKIQNMKEGTEFHSLLVGRMQTLLKLKLYQN